jgi:invasion protein IalB
VSVAALHLDHQHQQGRDMLDSYHEKRRRQQSQQHCWSQWSQASSKNLIPLVMDELINDQRSCMQLQFEVRSRANNRIRIILRESLPSSLSLPPPTEEERRGRGRQKGRKFVNIVLPLIKKMGQERRA